HRVLAEYSGSCGGRICWLPNVDVAHRAFLCSGGQAAHAIVRCFFSGEAGKLILTSVLFALTFAGVKPLAQLAVFGVFVLTQLVSWFAPLLMRTRLSRP
ncbi:F0F1 ATP synthase subunit I, partial [Pseudomonas sp. MWU12-2534b]